MRNKHLITGAAAMTAILTFVGVLATQWFNTVNQLDYHAKIIQQNSTDIKEIKDDVNDMKVHYARTEERLDSFEKLLITISKDVKDLARQKKGE